MQIYNLPLCETTTFDINSLCDIEGCDSFSGEYRGSNPEISSVFLVDGTSLTVNTRGSSLGIGDSFDISLYCNDCDHDPCDRVEVVRFVIINKCVALDWDLDTQLCDPCRGVHQKAADVYNISLSIEKNNIKISK